MAILTDTISGDRSWPN